MWSLNFFKVEQGDGAQGRVGGEILGDGGEVGGMVSVVVGFGEEKRGGFGKENGGMFGQHGGTDGEQEPACEGPLLDLRAGAESVKDDAVAFGEV